MEKLRDHRPAALMDLLRKTIQERKLLNLAPPMPSPRYARERYNLEIQEKKTTLTRDKTGLPFFLY